MVITLFTFSTIIRPFWSDKAKILFRVITVDFTVILLIKLGYFMFHFNVFLNLFVRSTFINTLVHRIFIIRKKLFQL